MATVNEVLLVAQREIGVTEYPKDSNKVKYNTEYYDREVSGSSYAWCVVFIWWIFKHANASDLFYGGGKVALCSRLYNHHRDLGQSVSTSALRPGDIVFFDFSGKKSDTDHVGIVESVNGSTITTIEGNTSSSSSGSQDNGGGVYRRDRNLKYITCAYRPRYSTISGGINMRVYLSPSNQVSNPYATGNTNEMVQCRKIADYCRIALERNGVEVKVGADGQSVSTRVAESNAYAPDIHIPIHTNAGGGSGCEVYVYGKTAERLKYATPIYNEIAAITMSSDRGIKENTTFQELDDTNSLCVYIECEFHDEATKAQWIIDNTEALGEAIAKGVCSGAGITFKEAEKKEEPKVEETPKEDPKVEDPEVEETPKVEETPVAGTTVKGSAYYIQIGPYYGKENAEQVKKFIAENLLPQISIEEVE